jgi:uncharacterized protein (TIGR02246 family)
MRRSVAFIVLAALVSISAAMFVAAADPVREAIDQGNQAFVEAFTAGDAKAVADLYTDDAKVIAPGAETATGRAAIEAHWAGAIASGMKVLRLQTAGVESDGALAVEDGTAVLADKDGKEIMSRYVVVWKRGDGRWRLHRDIFN